MRRRSARTLLLLLMPLTLIVASAESARPGLPLSGSTEPGPVRVGGNIQAPIRTKYVAPIHPPDAEDVNGIVILDVTIDVNGNVTNAAVLRSIPQLDRAAVDAVKQWQYAPTRLNGQPVPIIMSVTVTFHRFLD